MFLIIKDKYLKLFFLSSLLLLVSTKSMGKEKEIKWNVKVNNTYQQGGFKNFRSEINYILFPCFEVGSYVGYSLYYRSDRNYVRYNSPNHEDFLHIGIQTSFHPLTLLFEDLNRKLKIDFWIGLKLGQSVLYKAFLPGNYFYIESSGQSDPSGKVIWNTINYSRSQKEIQSNHFWEGGVSVGIGYYSKIGLGFYVEYSYGEYLSTLNERHDYRWGISYTF